MVAAGCEDGNVHLFRLPAWSTVWKQKMHQWEVSSVSISRDGRFLASVCSSESPVKISSLKTGALVRVLYNHAFDLGREVHFSQDSTKVLVIARKRVFIWRIFFATEIKVRSFCAALEVAEEDWGALKEVIKSMKRSYELDPQQPEPSFW
jgi:WD40 repeat protein